MTKENIGASSAESATRAHDGSKQDHSIQVISRACDILRALKDDTNGLSLGQIAAKVQLPRSTVQRIVNALLVEKLVMSSASESGLILGPEIHSLATGFKYDVAQALRPLLTQLSRDTGETVDLAVLRDNQLEFIDQVEGTHRLRTVSAVGEVFPLTDTANGKAVLSLMDEEQTTAKISAELGNSQKAKKHMAQLVKEIKTVRKQGYSLDIDEHSVGISAVGAAFIDSLGQKHAISIPVPSQRFDDKKAQLISCLLEAKLRATAISNFIDT